MALQKMVNGVYIDLTEVEIEQRAAEAEAADLNLNMVRAQRNSSLRGSDWTQIADATLGDHTIEEWATYRQALRDLPQTYNRVSEVVWPMDPPTQAAWDAAEAARLAAL